MQKNQKYVCKNHHNSTQQLTLHSSEIYVSEPEVQKNPI